MIDEVRTHPIPDSAWSGLAGALQFDNGDRPWYFEFKDQDLSVCAGLESVEVHFGDAAEVGCFQFEHTPLTSMMARVIAEAAIAMIERLGLDGAMTKLGFERIV